jgi:dimethylhistidine N-methyltransferase
MAIYWHSPGKIKYMEKTIVSTEMATEVLRGLKAQKKYISSKYFYDDEGSRIFRDIMAMPEYYPTACEAEIFMTHKRSIGELFCRDCSAVDLVELGAGDGQKTTIIIEDLLKQKVRFRYIPVDISEEAVLQLAGAMNQSYPDLVMEPRVGDYFHMLADLSRVYPNRKVVMFLGSNLGNYDYPQSIAFLSQISAAMSCDDLFFIGLDMKKDPEVIRLAYDDPHGHTSEFNLNLLRRMNRELGADFNTDQFYHRPAYDPESGVATSHLVSNKNQVVTIALCNESIAFREGESIYTEMSQKYDLNMIQDMAETAGFSVEKNFFDNRKYFVNSLWRKK